MAETPAPALDPIGQAIEALQTDRLDDALDLLLAAWRAAPHPRLADAIDGVSQLIRAPTPPELRSTHWRHIAAWHVLATQHAARELPALLDTLVDVAMASAASRLVQIERLPDDPRIDAAHLTWLETLPFQSNKSQLFWTGVFRRVARIRDVRQRARLDALDHQLETNVLGGRMNGWLRSQLAETLEHLASHLPPPGPPPPRSAELDRAIAAHTPLPSRRPDLDALLDAVHANPLDDGPRLVYADALLELGDPRGELIAMQLRPDDPIARKRAKALIHLHGKSWLGDLAPIVQVPRFERGFLAACTIDSRKRAVIARLVGHPDWSTVHTLAGSATIALDPVMRSLRSLRFDTAEPELQDLRPDAWRDLLTDTPRALTELHYASHWPWSDDDRAPTRAPADEPDHLAACAALPHLRQLTLVVRSFQPSLPSVHARIRRVLLGPVLDRLECLTFELESQATLAAFVVHLWPLQVPRLRLTLRARWTITLELLRGETGYQRGSLTLDGAPRFTHESLVEAALAVIAALPPTVTELAITQTTRGHNDRELAPTALARLHAARTARTA